MTFLENLKIVGVVFGFAALLVGSIAGIVIGLFSHPILLILAAIIILVLELTTFITLIQRWV